MPPRATALPPSQRRAVLVECALDLIRRSGAVPSTREIAEAAGVAEGTIFRAFDTKDSLIDEAIASSFCPAPLLRQLQQVDPGLPLRERLVAVVTILQRRYGDLFDLMHGLRLSAPPVAARREHTSCTPEAGHVASSPDDGSEDQPGDRDHRHPDRELTNRAVVALIEPDASDLTCSAQDLARYLRMLTFSGSHPQISDSRLLSPETIVDVLLTGVLTTTSRKAG